MQDGDQDVIQLAMRHVIDARELGQDDDDLRFSPEGLARFQALMARAEDSIKAGRTLPSDEFWTQAQARHKDRVKTP